MDLMNLKTVYLAVLVMVLLQVQASQAKPEGDAKQWLERMIQAARTLNYEGTFVYLQGQHLEAMHIIHGSSGDEERQRMFSLTGPRREVVVANQQVICLLPKQQTTFNDSDYKRSLFPISLPRKLEELEENYRFEMLDDDRVADMKARIVVIQPRDKLRFGYRLWLDHKTGMVLRSVLFDEEGQTLEQMMFTDLQLKPEIDPVLLEPPNVQQTQPARVGVTGEKVEQSDWTLATLPKGFMKAMHTRFAKIADNNTHFIEHIVLTDGLATVSVFLEPLVGAKPLLEGTARMGAINAFGRVIGDHQVLVVGEVPESTVETIASSVQYTSQAAAR